MTKHQKLIKAFIDAGHKEAYVKYCGRFTGWYFETSKEDGWLGQNFNECIRRIKNGDIK